MKTNEPGTPYLDDYLKRKETEIPGVSLHVRGEAVDFQVPLTSEHPAWNGKLVKVAVSIRNGQLHISVDEGRLAVRPRASNVVTIGVED